MAGGAGDAAGPAGRAGTAEEAFAHRDWPAARRALEAELEDRETPEALEALGMACWWLGEVEATRDARERAYRAFNDDGQRLAAARVATWLGYDAHILHANPAVGAGWFARAWSLLEVAGEVPERGWLAFREGEIALQLHQDPERALALGEQALELGRRLEDVDLEMVGLSLRGLAMVARGEVGRGMRSLDEATAAAVAGDMRVPNAAANVCCHLIFACEWVHDLERAAQWCDVVVGSSVRFGMRGLFAVCSTHYGHVLMWRGRWEEAEAQLAGASQAFAAAAPGLAFEASVALAELRRRQGRLEEARSLCAGLEWSPEAQLCLAAVAEELGELEAASELAERHLRALGPAARLRRAPGLALAARVWIAAGQPERAAEACSSLRSLAAEVQTAPLLAAAALSDGLLAASRELHDLARRDLEDAVDLWAGSGAPYEEARARLELARVLLALGRDGGAAAEARRAREGLAALGAAAEEARAGELLLRAEQTPDGHDTVLSTRELEVLRLVADGLGDQEIASRLVLSPHTVHRHVANIRSKLREPSRAAAAAHAIRAGLI
jgi:ATP/maltotriose-dependent transcriptional regulator MalT